jgi:glycosyltransferase involved in cell wall biosynthesis
MTGIATSRERRKHHVPPRAHQRVLVVSERFHPESFLVNELVSELTARRFDVTVLTQAPSYPAGRLYPGFRNRIVTFGRFEGARVIRIFTVPGYRENLVLKVLHYLNFAVLTTLIATLSGRRYDAIFVYQAGALTQATLAIACPLAVGTRTVIWTQDVWPHTVFAFGFTDRGLLCYLLEVYVRSVYRRFDEILVSSPGFVKALQPYLSRGKIVQFVPQWTPREVLAGHEVPSIYDASRVNFVFAGNVGSMQNLEILIRAFASVARVDRRPVLTIIGDGSYRQRLERQAYRTGVDNVRFVGRHSAGDIRSLLSRADVLVLPLAARTGVELTLPAKLTTYLTVRKPILAVASGEVRRIVEQYGLGIAIAPDDEESLVGAIRELASWGTKQRDAVAERARSVDETLFDRERSIEHIAAAITGSVRCGYGA